MKKRKKFLRLLLSIALCFAMFPLGVSAEEISEPIYTEEVSDSTNEEENIDSESAEEKMDTMTEEDITDNGSENETTVPVPEEEITTPIPEDETDETAGADVTPSPEPESDKRPSDLSVGGVWVTKDNAADIFGDGTASYDAESKTLTLNNATLTNVSSGYGDAAIKSWGDINIVLQGENTISVDEISGSFGIVSDGITTFTGDGLDIYADYGVFSYEDMIVNGANILAMGVNMASFGTLDINGGLLSVGGTLYGNHVEISDGASILANPREEGAPAISALYSVSISSSMILAYSKNAAAIDTYTDIIIKDSYVSANSSAANGAFKAASLEVSGTWIEMNDEISADIDASITDSVVFTGESGEVIGNYIVPVEIGAWLAPNQSLTIPEGASVIVPAGAEWINYGEVNLAGEFIVEEGGIVECVRHHVNLIKVEENKAGYDYDGNIEYWYCDVCGKYYSSEAASDSDEISYEQTIIPAISKSAPLVVGDVLVTEDNAADIFGDGTASYDFTTKTLTLKGANISKSLGDGYAVVGSDSDLTIVLEGENVIDVTGSWPQNEAVLALGNLTVKGSGSLSVRSGSLGVGCWNVLTVDGASLDIETVMSAVVGGEGINIINGADITVKVSGEGVAVYTRTMVDAVDENPVSDDDVVITGSTVNIEAENGMGMDIFGDVYITDSNVSCKAYMPAIAAENDVYISGGELYADTTGEWNTIMSNGSVEITGGAVAEISADSYPAIGVGDQVLIFSSTVKASCENECSIYAGKNITVEDSYIETQSLKEGLRTDDHDDATTESISIINSILKANSKEAAGTVMTDELTVTGSWIDMTGAFDEKVTVSVTDSAVIEGSAGEVTGELILPYSVELAEGKTLTILEEASVTVPAGITFTNAGTVVLNGEFAVEEGGKGVCVSEHTGGTATETSKAVCEICGEEYGELKPSDPGNDDETTDKPDAGKPDTDKPGTNKPGGNDKTDETGKLDKTPETGDRNDTAVWVMLIAVAGAALAGGAAYNKKRK